MRIENISNECTGCMACYSCCPKQCISVQLDSEGFYYPIIDNNKCISCGKCEAVCHCLNKPEKIQSIRKSYYGFSRSDEILHKSTSGGAFYHLAQHIIYKGGNVYGAAFDLDERILRHTDSDSVGLDALLKSKYIESAMNDTIRKIQRDIDSGRYVLFCGSPCEVSGVRKAVDDKSSHLLLVDFICHGVPSSMLFKEHLDKIIGNEQLTKLDFRPKDNGWLDKNIVIKIKSKYTTKTTPYAFDSFYAGFMTYNAFLRKCCYECNFRSEHFSDITIADFWGYRDYDPNLNNEKGLSLIVAHTEKGDMTLQSIRDEFNLYDLDNKYSDYAFNQRDYSEAFKLRKKFYSLYEKSGFEYAAGHTYMKGIWKNKLKRQIKKLLGMV